MSKFDPTKPVQTRNGNKARIICTDRQRAPGVKAGPIIALVVMDDGTEQVQSYSTEGEYPYGFSDQPNGKDLVNVPEKWFVHVWRDRDGRPVTGHPFQYNSVNPPKPPMVGDAFIKTVEIEL